MILANRRACTEGKPRPLTGPLRGSTPLAHYARCVVEDFAAHERDLALALSAWQTGSPHERQQLGDPSTIVLESELIASLATRLRSTPWMTMAAVHPDHGSPLSDGHCTLLLLGCLFRVLDFNDTAGGTPPQPGAPVLRSLLRQV